MRQKEREREMWSRFCFAMLVAKVGGWCGHGEGNIALCAKQVDPT